MKKMKNCLTVIVAFVVSMTVASAPVMAYGPMEVFGVEEEKPVVETNILNVCGNESSGQKKITCVLKLIVEILSIGVGILGVIGIAVSGIQYLTAGGNEERTRKAKRRLFEIVLGLAVYAVIFALLEWLLPSF